MTKLINNYRWPWKYKDHWDMKLKNPFTASEANIFSKKNVRRKRKPKKFTRLEKMRTKIIQMLRGRKKKNLKIRKP